MQIMDLLGMYFDAAVVFVTSTFIQIGSGHTVIVHNLLQNCVVKEIP